MVKLGRKRRAGSKNFRSAKLLQKRRKRAVLKFVLFGFSFTVLFFSIFFLSRADFLLIEEVKIVGADTISQRQLMEEVNSLLGESTWGLFPKKNIFLYPKKTLQNLLKDKFKKIADVRIGLKRFKTLEIGIIERKPVAIWCRNESDFLSGTESESLNLNQSEEDFSPEPKEDLEDSEKEIQPLSERCFFVDRLGFIFSPSPSFSGDSFLKYYGDVSEENPLGSYFFNENDAQKIESFFRLIEELQAFPERIEKHSRENVEIYLNTGTKLVLNLDDDIDNISENLVTLISEPEFSSGASDNLFFPFSSIDLRFGNRLLYKLKELPED